MSPTVFRYKSYRFFFFSREEKRMHIHVSGPEGEAKFWIEPIVSLADNYRMPVVKLKRIQGIIEEHVHEIKKAWKKHFED